MTTLHTLVLAGALIAGAEPVSTATTKDPSKVAVYDTTLPAGLQADGDLVKVADGKRFQSMGKIEAMWVDEKHETNAPADIAARKKQILAKLQREVVRRHGNVLVITSWFRRDDVDPVTNTVRETFDAVGAEGAAISDKTPSLNVADAAQKP